MDAPTKRKQIILPDPNPITPDPCPCGGRAWLRTQKKLRGDIFAVECEVCGREGPASPLAPRAVERWNEERIS